MTENKRTVEQYMEAFMRGDHAEVLACLTDDVEWQVPGFFHVTGKERFRGQIRSEGFTGHPTIATTRLTEENDVVVAEGTVRTQKADGDWINLMFCDVFVLQDGRIRQLTSYLMQVP